MPALAARPAAASSLPTRTTAVLVSGCDGYPAGTTGAVRGERGGCVVFAPHHPERVAAWARPVHELVVPPALLVIAD